MDFFLGCFGYIIGSLVVVFCCIYCCGRSSDEENRQDRGKLEYFKRRNIPRYQRYLSSEWQIIEKFRFLTIKPIFLRPFLS